MSQKPKERDNLTEIRYEKSPEPLKKKTNEIGKTFLSEQKENSLKKHMNYEKKPSQRLYFPFSSPNNAKILNSPNKFFKNDEFQNNSNKKPQKKNNNLELELKNNQFLSSLKNFSEDFISSTTSFINSNLNKMSDRKQCSCEMGLGKQESCKTALKWFKSNQNDTGKLNDLKILYGNLQKEKGDEKAFDQIKRDVLRTYSNNAFFHESSNGFLQIKKVFHCIFF